MKIISKFKDFYDYLAQDYDADIIYVREAKYRGNINEISSLYKSEYTWFKRDTTKIIDFRYVWPFKLGDLVISNFVYGVYPYVYSVPILVIACLGYDYSKECRDPLIEYLSRSFVDSLCGVDKKEEARIFNEFALECVKNYNKKNKDTFPFAPREENIEYKLSNIHGNELSYNLITTQCKKLECSEVFDKLKSPIFIEEDTFIDLYHAGYQLKKEDNVRYSQYVVDLSLTAISPQIIKYWYDDLVNINTYNDIENFLWSQKQEPISEPTNKQKILNHGFDIKTSFRKM